MAKTVADVMKMVKENEVKFVDFRFSDTLRLVYGKPPLNRQHFDWRLADLPTPAARPVRLGDHKANIGLAVEQFAKGRDGEIGSPEKY